MNAVLIALALLQGVLAPDAQIERVLSGSEHHTYQLRLNAGELALARVEAVRSPDDFLIMKLFFELADVAQDRVDNAATEQLLQRALAVAEKTLGSDDPRTAYIWARLAGVYARTGQRPKAEKLLRSALDVTEKTLGPDHQQVARCLITMGDLRERTGELVLRGPQEGTRSRGGAAAGAARDARPEGRQHPFYWASFIEAGEWASLDGHR
jgi:tetratricopeptide (TPR) repeat protein